MLGGLRARNGEVELAHFPSRAVASLLARLALYPDRAHTREELAELLWTDVEPGLARNRLRNALSTLRRLLEVPDLPAKVVLIADRRGVRLNGSVVDCDAVAFERHVQLREFEAARARYTGHLLPGFYDAWIEDERSRLAALFERLSRTDVEEDGAPTARDVDAAAIHPRDDEPARANEVLGALPLRHVPRFPTSFVGRADELGTLAGLMARARLVTITGPAGCGKTRLAIEHAARAKGFDRVVWVPLISCAAPAMVLEHVRATLGLHAGSTLPLDQVAANLEEHSALLVLDNLEHLLGADAAAPFLAQLLERIPTLRILATSQRAPASEGLQLPLRPLAVPPSRQSAAEALRNPAVQLFVQRARDRRADFNLHARNASELIAVCRALDGLPLAIELAAARIRQVGLREMGAALAAGALSLDARGGRGTADARPDRHQSLTHAIGWTWGLLEPPQREAFAALSILRGDFDAATAAAIASWPPGSARARLVELEAFSLLQAGAPEDGLSRWGMLAPLRAFAQTQVTREQSSEARRRHRHWFLAKARDLATYARPVDTAELPDFLHAIETGLDDTEVTTAAATALALRAQWVSHGTSPLALALFERLADAEGLDQPTRASLVSLYAPLLLDAGLADQARQRAEHAVRLAHGVSAQAEIDAQIAWVQVTWRGRRDGGEVLPAARLALQRARQLRAPDLIGRACMSLGAITWAHLHDPAEARALFVEAEGAFEAHGDPRAALTALPGHVACLLLEDRFREAADLAERGVKQARRFRDVQTELLLLNRLAECYARGRRYALSVDASRQLVHLAHRHAMSYHLAFAIWNLSLPLARLGQSEAAALLMAFSQRYWTEHFGDIWADDEAYVAKVRASVERRVGKRAWTTLWARGWALAFSEVIALAGGARDMRTSG